MASQVAEYARSLSKDSSTKDAQEVDTFMSDWLDCRRSEMKKVLAERLGETARSRFKTFVNDYTVAESQDNLPFLQGFCVALDLAQPFPRDYEALRTLLAETELHKEMTEGAWVLGEIQTWLDLKGRIRTTPTLATWMNRGAPQKTASPSQPPRKRNPLAAAEPDLPEFSADTAGEVENPMDAFTQLRDTKHEQRISEAQEGMQQVAAERKAVEEELGSRELAKAKEEAANLKRHAEQLASAEKEALKQRENSWGTRLKKMAGSVVKSTGGAFLGTIGEKAGTEAADSIFE